MPRCNALPLYAKLSPHTWDFGDGASRGGGGRRRPLAREHDPRRCARRRRSSRRLGTLTGGLSGPALKPIALAAVLACRRVTDLPIVGMGGVMTGRDALELVAAGASDVALGTTLFRRPRLAVANSRASSTRKSPRSGSRDVERHATLRTTEDSHTMRFTPVRVERLTLRVSALDSPRSWSRRRRSRDKRQRGRGTREWKR